MNTQDLLAAPCRVQLAALTVLKSAGAAAEAAPHASARQHESAWSLQDAASAKNVGHVLPLLRMAAASPDAAVRRSASGLLVPLLAPYCGPARGSSSTPAAAARAAAAAAVLLCLYCAVGIAAAQQTSCPSRWSTAVLSEGRYDLAAASLPNQGLAIFAGGQNGGL